MRGQIQSEVTHACIVEFLLKVALVVLEEEVDDE